MKSLFVALFFVGFALAQDSTTVGPPAAERNKNITETCHTIAKACCDSDDAKAACEIDCSSLISHDEVFEDFIKLANEHLVRSYEYFFLSAQFGTYSKDRPGFEKILHGLSDSAWNTGIDMIKKLNKRGGEHKFDIFPSNMQSENIGDSNEMEALGKAVDIEKNILDQAQTIHRRHSHATYKDSLSINYDADLAHYLEEEIIEGKTETLRNLVGHVNDLKKLKKNSSIFPMSLYLFDQYLQK